MSKFDHLRGVHPGAIVVDEAIGSFGGEAERDLATDALARARDERGFAGE